MAKIKYSALVSDMRGKLNGSVASKNRYGSYWRNKVTPVNPATSYQTNLRQMFTAVTQAWRSLTAAQREQWRAAVNNFKSTNIFGDSIQLSGSNLHQRLNVNLLNIGQSVSTTPPLPEAVEAVTSLSAAVSKTASTMVLTFSPAITAATKILVFATAPQSAGKNFVKSEYRQIMVADNSDVSPLSVKTEYEAKFGAIGAVGTKVFFKLVPIDVSTGIPSSAITCSAIAV